MGELESVLGYMRHHAIVVTSFDAERVAAVHSDLTAKKLGCLVTPILPSAINGYRSFAVLPDGSKEGWDASAEGDAFRDAVIDALRAHIFEDRSSPFSWVEVQYGDDDGMTCVTRDSDAHKRGE